MNSIIQLIAVCAIPLIFSITMHEAAHGYAARKFGDNTAWMMGRVTLNPAKHIDPFGTIILPLIMLAGSAAAGGVGFIFGWAKPVPVNFGALRNPKRDMIWVALAGPGCNLLQAVIWGIILKLLVIAGVQEQFFLQMAVYGISINIFLMAFNLIPIPPLDGGRFVVEVFQKVSRRVVSTRALNYISAAGMLLFLGFFLIMANQDIQRFVFGNW